MSVADEAAGLIKGLAEIVKSQQSVQQHALQQTADQLQTLSHTVASLTQNLPSSSVGSSSPGLRLHHLVLPLYWWFAYDVIKNMTMQIMINLPLILV